MAASNPTFDQLKARMTRLFSNSSAFSATVYRSCTPKYANVSDLVTGEGSRRHGGRWNPVGMAVVYASLTPETAMVESLAHYRYYGIGLEQAMPRTFVSMTVNLDTVLDFRQGIVRRSLQVSEERILSVDWRKEIRDGREPITQTISRAALVAGFEGMIVPSAADPKHHNLLVFSANFGRNDKIQVLDADRLPR
jgi:RES domain-containing protein